MIKKIWEESQICRSITFIYFVIPHSLTVSWRYNSHTTQSTHLKCKVQQFQYIHGVRQLLPDDNLRTFSSCPKETRYILAVTPHSSKIPITQATTDLFSVSMEFPILAILQKWNCTTCGLCLASFPSDTVFKVHPSSGVI